MNTIQIVVNGDERRVPTGQSITDLLGDLGLHPRMIVVEHNREILDREKFSETELHEGDALELVHFVGGG